MEVVTENLFKTTKNLKFLHSANLGISEL